MSTVARKSDILKRRIRRAARNFMQRVCPRHCKLQRRREHGRQERACDIVNQPLLFE